MRRFRLDVLKLTDPAPTLARVYEAARAQGYRGWPRDLVGFNGWEVDLAPLPANLTVYIPHFEEPSPELGHGPACPPEWLNALAARLVESPTPFALEFPQELGLAGALDVIARAVYQASTFDARVRLPAAVNSDTTLWLEPYLLQLMLDEPGNAPWAQRFFEFLRGERPLETILEGAAVHLPDIRAANFMGKVPSPPLG